MRLKKGYYPKRQCSEQGSKLANKFWSYLVDTVRHQPKGSETTNLLEKWAVTFDVCLREHTFEHVCTLLDFCVSEYNRQKKNNEKPFVYWTPDAFIGSLSFIAQKYERVSRPIPEADLKDFLLPLKRDRWQCSWDSLVTSVSKSVCTLRSFLCGLRDSAVVEDLKRRIRSIFGDTHYFIVHHYQQWRRKKLEAVWTATINARFLFSLVRRCLSQLGFSEKEIRSCCEKIWAAMDLHKCQ